jgi:hypothetical protein
MDIYLKDNMKTVEYQAKPTKKLRKSEAPK